MQIQQENYLVSKLNNLNRRCIGTYYVLRIVSWKLLELWQRSVKCLPSKHFGLDLVWGWGFGFVFILLLTLNAVFYARKWF